jgi:Ras-related protein Rab-5C
MKETRHPRSAGTLNQTRMLLAKVAGLIQTALLQISPVAEKPRDHMTALNGWQDSNMKSTVLQKSHPLPSQCRSSVMIHCFIWLLSVQRQDSITARMIGHYSDEIWSDGFSLHEAQKRRRTLSPMRGLKVVLVGQARVGKSCLLRRIVDDTFDDQQINTIGTAFSTVLRQTPSGTLQLQIWDTAGQEQYRSLASMYYRNAHVALLVYDYTQGDSLTRLTEWTEEVSSYAPGNIKSVLIANKVDLSPRAISYQQAKLFAESIRATAYLETSAKTGEGVVELMSVIEKIDPMSDCASTLLVPQADRRYGCC